MSPAVSVLAQPGVRSRIVSVALGALPALLLARESDWHPLWLFGGLAAAALASDFFIVIITPQLSVTAALVPVVLAGAFLGPLPAAAIGAASSAVDGTRRSIALKNMLGNVASFCVLGVGVGLVGRAIDIRATHGPALLAEATGLYAATSSLSLLFAALNSSPDWRGVVRSEVQQTGPAEALLAVTTGVAALFYGDGEYEALVSLGAVALLFSYFAGALSFARGGAPATCSSLRRGRHA